MKGQGPTPRDALTRLGASTAEAVGQVLESFAPGSVRRGEVSVLPDGRSPFTGVPAGALAISVSYVDGVSGANILLLEPGGARELATAMGVPPPELDFEHGGAPDLSELELSAVSEAANQTMAAAASAISLVIGHEVDISPPDSRILPNAAAADEIYGTAAHAISATFVIAGVSCRLIQLVPAAFVMRMLRAMDELRVPQPSGNASGDEGSPAVAGVEDTLGSINLRVWAELGRAELALGRALELPLGAVVDLDRAADAPVDLYVNGLCFAQGHLLVTDEGEWALVIDELGGRRTGADASDVTPEPQPQGAAS